MKQLQKILLLVVPLAVGVASLAPPGRAQQPLTGRFALADTTLMRDTLGLTFEGLFQTADSLGMTPDTLRNLSVRYQFPIARLLWLSDSLGAPVDSVGVILMRERFNPLARTVEPKASFIYTSNYTLNETSDGWANTGTFDANTGPYYLNNTTDVTLTNLTSGTTKSVNNVRTSRTELGYTLSRRLSVGGVASLSRQTNNSQGVNSAYGTSEDNYQFTLRSKPQTGRTLSSELNFLAGYLDVDNTAIIKRGPSAEVNGRLRILRGQWLTHDARGYFKGNIARSRPPTAIETIPTQDLQVNLSGTLAMWSSSPIAFNTNYQLYDSEVETVNSIASNATGLDSAYAQKVLTSRNSIDFALRARLDNERYLNITQRFASSSNASNNNLASLNAQGDRTFGVIGRYAYRAFTLDANFGLVVANAEYPRRTQLGGYSQNAFTRQIGATLGWTPAPGFIYSAKANVSLGSSRFAVIDSFPSPPVPNDQYRQDYELKGNYTPSRRFTTALSLSVQRVRAINIPAASTAANYEGRSYQSTWSWSYLLLAGLTAAQVNRIASDYTYASLVANNRLGMTFTSLTTLNATLSPRLQLNITHQAGYQPSGNWLPDEHGIYYLAIADETQNYDLKGDVSYRPIPAINLNVSPSYLTTTRKNVLDGELVPQRSSKNLTISGGARVDLPISSKARVGGTITRNFNSNRAPTYSQGIEQPTPLIERDFWSGSVNLTWTL